MRPEETVAQRGRGPSRRWFAVAMIGLVLAVLQCHSVLRAESKPIMTEREFTDRIQDFHTEQGKVTVLFFAAAAPYTIDAAREDFAALVGKLAAGWKARQPIKVVVRGMEIIGISPAK
jgi:2-keto-3-deoxy-galactonokinase